MNCKKITEGVTGNMPQQKSLKKSNCWKLRATHGNYKTSHVRFDNLSPGLTTRFGTP
jgi:hypothetical protein